MSHVTTLTGKPLPPQEGNPWKKSKKKKKKKAGK